MLSSVHKNKTEQKQQGNVSANGVFG